jgi:hypothetical protein
MQIANNYKNTDIKEARYNKTNNENINSVDMKRNLN